MNTPISTVFVDGRKFFVKRDDLIDPFLAGNKYRKLYSLLQTPSKKFDTIISYGGTQSNAMLAIAAMCNKKGWTFIYYTKTLSDTQRIEKNGNFYEALKLGMQHIEIEHERYKDTISALRLNLDEKSYIIDQGGADIHAKEGLEVLAKEIREQNLHVRSLATPSGTGTTALFLALALPEYIVYTAPSVGSVEYLKEQMLSLAEIPKNLIILKPDRKYHFAKPYPQFLQVYKKLQKTDIDFDLLYAPNMWKCLLEQTDEEILYIHSGGVTGNESMLQRYKNKGLIG